MRANRYSGKCLYCGNKVSANAGCCFRVGRRWVVAHLACREERAPAVITTTFSSGETVSVNARGRCEDAPCCGCCS